MCLHDSISFQFTFVGVNGTDSDVARGLPPVAAFLVWFLEVALGLGVAIAATWWLGGFRSVAARPPLFQLLVGGLIGSLVFAPLSLGLEAVFPSPGEDSAEGWLDALEQSGGVFALVAEWLQLAPAYLASWAILNVPPTFAAVGARDTVADPPPASAVSEPEPQPEPQPEATSGTLSALSNPLLARIPAAIGTDLVFARSDLHYLQLRTTLGSTLSARFRPDKSADNDRFCRAFFHPHPRHRINKNFNAYQRRNG